MCRCGKKGKRKINKRGGLYIPRRRLRRQKDNGLFSFIARTVLKQADPKAYVKLKKNNGGKKSHL